MSKWSEERNTAIKPVCETPGPTGPPSSKPSADLDILVKKDQHHIPTAPLSLCSPYQVVTTLLWSLHPRVPHRYRVPWQIQPRISFRLLAFVVSRSVVTQETRTRRPPSAGLTTTTWRPGTQAPARTKKSDGCKRTQFTMKSRRAPYQRKSLSARIAERKEKPVIQAPLLHPRVSPSCSQVEAIPGKQVSLSHPRMPPSCSQVEAIPGLELF